MNAAFSSVRLRALDTISQFSSSKTSRSSLPTSSSSWLSSHKSKRSTDRPRLFTSSRPNADAATGSSHTRSISEEASKSTALFVLGCLAWYTSSSLSSNTSKALLSKGRAPKGEGQDWGVPPPVRPPAFPYPVTLTLIHFIFVNVCCAICASRRILGSRALTRLVKPSFSRVAEVGQLAFFNVMGQALSSLAISRVPVATVHTIKALSPLFTVLSYTYLFNVTYSSKTYMSLLPLTSGVMMACTGFAFNADDIVGFGAALGSTFVFVAQNIYSKKLLRKGEKDGIPGTDSEKMDKINILFYSSACSIVLMIPMALYYDGSAIFSNPSWRASAAWPHDRGMLVLWLLLCNGLVHFAQNILAFNVLSMVSPVTYSIASLLKRVFVIVLAIIWFGQAVSLLQWFGIALTFYGLWMYNDSKTKDDVQKGERKVERKQVDSQGLLPLSTVSITSSANDFGQGLHSRPHPSAPPQGSYQPQAAGARQPYIAPSVGGWNDVPDNMLRSYIKDPTKSLPSPPDSDKEV